MYMTHKHTRVATVEQHVLKDGNAICFYNSLMYMIYGYMDTAKHIIIYYTGTFFSLFRTQPELQIRLFRYLWIIIQDKQVMAWSGPNMLPMAQLKIGCNNLLPGEGPVFCHVLPRGCRPSPRWRCERFSPDVDPGWNRVGWGVGCWMRGWSGPAAMAAREQ